MNISKKYKIELLVIFSYFLLSVLFTFPLIFSLNRVVFGYLGDQVGLINRFWWEKYALSQGFDPLNHFMYGAPFGIKLDEPFSQPLSWWTQRYLGYIFNEIVAYNLVILLSFPLSALAAYLLIRNLVKDDLIGFIGGMLFAFSPFHTVQVQNHSALSQIWVLPLFLLALLRLAEKPSNKRALLAGLALTVAVLTSNYYGYFLILFTLLFIPIYKIIFKRFTLKYYSLFFIYFFLFTLPVIFPFIQYHLKASGGDVFGRRISYSDLFTFSARPWHYLLPSVGHPVLGALSKRSLVIMEEIFPQYLTQNYFPEEQTLFIGFTVLIFFAVSLRYILKEAESGRYILLFAVLASVFVLLSAPPYVDVKGQRLFFPSHFLFKVFPFFRVYARLGILVLLCLLVAASFGLKVFFLNFRGVYRKLAIVWVVSFSFFEFFQTPGMVKNEPPPEYIWLARHKEYFIIMEYPYKYSGKSVFWQRIYKKGLLNPRDFKNAEFDSEKFTEDFTREEGNIDKIKKLGVKYIVYHQNDQENSKAEFFLNSRKIKKVENFGDKAYIFEVRDE